jgi:hypothetical protein
MKKRTRPLFNSPVRFSRTAHEILVVRAFLAYGGEGGIRTHGTLADTAVFKFVQRLKIPSAYVTTVFMPLLLLNRFGGLRHSVYNYV